MKRFVLFLLFVLLIAFAVGCEADNNGSDTKLLMVNNHDGREVKGVSLVGYNFTSLAIPPGGSQTFTLSNGMPGGYNNINVNVHYGSGLANWYVDKTYNFTEGGVTTVTLNDSGLLE